MNFKHLHYFWVTAKAGGVMRAAEQLHTTPQTVSGQIKLLEDALGHKLFRKQGRNLELTEDGRTALGFAEQIFTLGNALEAAVRQARDGQPILDFRVGVADSVAKSLAYHLLEPALLVDEPVRLVCSEGKFPDLMSQLALHRLDLVLADEPMSRRMSVRAFNHLLGSTHMSFFCAPRLRKRLRGPFPQCLNDAPMLIPGLAASVRGQLEGWFTLHQVQPRIVGEFEDGALMTAFGREARGVFMGPSVLEEEIVAQQGVEVLGRSSELEEQLFAISVERHITHPCLRAITEAARDHVFGARAPRETDATAPS